jgi:serine/threonine protein kinase
VHRVYDGVSHDARGSNPSVQARWSRISSLDMPLTTGTRLAQYEILGPLGAGGMGEVYRARHTKLNRDVAVKVLPEEVDSATQAIVMELVEGPATALS